MRVSTAPARDYFSLQDGHCVCPRCLQDSHVRLVQTLTNFLGLTPIPFQPLALAEGERPPNFFDGSYEQAVNKARDEFKFLIVYLHSPQHSDTPKFCR